MGITQSWTPIEVAFPHLTANEFDDLARRVREVPNITGIDSGQLEVDSRSKTLRYSGATRGVTYETLIDLFEVIAPHLGEHDRLTIDIHPEGTSWFEQGESQTFHVSRGSVTEARYLVLGPTESIKHIGSSNKGEDLEEAVEALEDTIGQTKHQLQLLERQLALQRTLLGQHQMRRGAAPN